MGRRLHVAILALVLVLSLVLMQLAPPTLSRSYLTLCVAIAIGIFVVQCAAIAAGPKPTNWFTVEFVFILAFLMVHYTAIIYWLLGLTDLDNYFWRNGSIVCYATMMSVAGLAAFALGFNLPAAARVSTARRLTSDVNNMVSWRLVGKLMLAVSVVLGIVWVAVLGEQLTEGAYGTIRYGFTALALFLAIRWFINLGVALVIVAGAKLTGKLATGLVLKVIVVLFGLEVLILGYRMTFITLMLVGAAAYSECVKAISLKKIAVGVCAILLVVTVAGLGRTSVRRTFGSALTRALAQTTQLPLKEHLSLQAVKIGGSMHNVFEAVSVIPARYAYFRGRLKVAELMGIIPLGRRLLPPRQFTNSSYFLTWSIHGSYRSGTGSTVVADVYVDFGLPGVLVVLFLLGAGCKVVQRKARESSSLLWLVAYVCLLQTMVIMSRNTVLGVIRDVMWPLLAVYVLATFMQLQTREEVRTGAGGAGYVPSHPQQ